MREERRPGKAPASPELLAQHAAEVEALTKQVAVLQVILLLPLFMACVGVLPG